MRASSVSSAPPSSRGSGSARSITSSGALGSRSSSTAEAIAAISSGVVPQQPPISLAPSRRAWAANSAKYSGVAWG